MVEGKEYLDEKEKESKGCEMKLEFGRKKLGLEERSKVSLLK